MRLVHRQRPTGRHPGRCLPRQLSSLGAALSLLVVLTPGGNATPAASSSRPRAASLCSASKGLAANIVQSASISTIAGTPEGSPSYYEKIAAAEPSLDLAARGKLAEDLKKVFPVINVLINDLKQAHSEPGRARALRGAAPHRRGEDQAPAECARALPGRPASSTSDAAAGGPARPPRGSGRGPGTYPRGMASARRIVNEDGAPRDHRLADRARRSKISDRLNELTRQFIERSPFVCVATKLPGGGLDVSPRGDPPSFVRILDERTLLIPDRPGNRIADTLTNLLADPSIGSSS